MYDRYPWNCRATTTIRYHRDNGRLDIPALRGIHGVLCVLFLTVRGLGSCFVISMMQKRNHCLLALGSIYGLPIGQRSSVTRDPESGHGYLQHCSAICMEVQVAQTHRLTHALTNLTFGRIARVRIYFPVQHLRSLNHFPGPRLPVI